jgi:hypothetical protein
VLVVAPPEPTVPPEAVAPDPPDPVPPLLAPDVELDEHPEERVCRIKPATTPEMSAERLSNAIGNLRGCRGQSALREGDSKLLPAIRL